MNEGRYDDAITTCNELIEVDFTNSRKWSARISDINIKKERAVEDRKRWEKLVKDIDSAQWEEDWGRIITLCKEALNIKDNPDIRTKLEKAEAKFKTENELKMLDKTIAEIKDLILISHYTEAKKKLTQLQSRSLDSVHDKEVRDLFKLIFDKENEADGFTTTHTGVSPGQPINDPFWDTPSEPYPISKYKKQKAKSGDDFFDSVGSKSKSQQKRRVSEPTGKITNDDFNFK